MYIEVGKCVMAAMQLIVEPRAETTEAEGADGRRGLIIPHSNHWKSRKIC